MLYRRLSPAEAEAQGRESVAVAVRSEHLLATAFHPELTDDLRWCASTPVVLPHQGVWFQKGAAMLPALLQVLIEEAGLCLSGFRGTGI